MKSRVQKKETRWEKLDNTANLFRLSQMRR